MEILFTIIGLSLVVLIHEFGHFIAAKLTRVRVHEFGLGFPPRLFSFVYHGTIYSFNLFPLGGFVKLEGEDDLGSANLPSGSLPSDSFLSKSLFSKIFILCAGVFMNILLGFFVMVLVFIQGIPERVMIAQIAPNGPAAVAGLEQGDSVMTLKFGDTLLEQPRDISEVIAFIKETKGEAFSLSVLRGKDVVSYLISGRENPPPGEGALGVSLVQVGFPAQSFFESIGRAFAETFSILKEIVIQFGLLIGRVFTGSDALKQVTGPVGIFQIAIQTSSLGILYFIHFLGFISLNLAVFNLIPFPALDGGRVLFELISRVFGSRFSRRFQMISHVVGFGLLILLMLIVTARDVARFF